MPDLRDLHNEFARLEQEIPEYYRSPVIAERMAQILDQPRRRAHTGRRPTIAMALLAAAAVVALAVAVVSISRRSGDHAPVGQNSTAIKSPPISNSPSTQGSPSQSTSTHSSSTPKANGAAMPQTGSELISYIQGAALVKVSDYEQGEPGPGQAMRPTPGIAEFNTPSGNITCAIVDIEPGGPADVQCEAQQASFHIPPKPASCQNDWAGYFGFIEQREVTVGACVGGPEFGPTTQVLPYGSAIRQAGIGCRSESGFLACADLSTGHGFAVNRDTLKTY